MKREKHDAAASKIPGLLPEITEYPNDGVPDYRRPAWVTEFLENPKEISLRGREGAVLLDRWRGQTESALRVILEREEWGLLRVLGV